MINSDRGDSMKFQEYNPAIKNCDCVIRTFMKLLEKDYLTVRRDLLSIAESLGYDSYNVTEVFEKYFEKNGYTKIEEEPVIVNDLSLDGGKYGIFCYRDEDYHLFPVIDRVAFDKSDRFWKMNVISLYRLEK